MGLIRISTWHYTSGLTGVTGTIGGSVAGGDAFIVLDGASGTGVTIPEPALALSLTSVGLLALRRRR